MSTTTQERPNGAVKAPAGPRQRTNEAAPVRWPLNAKYGLGRDEAQFIIYRTVEPKSGVEQRRRSHQYRPVSYHPTLEGALMWVVMRQAHFDNEPTIDTDILDAFQRYCHHMDQAKADIKALAERLEAAIERQGS